MLQWENPDPTVTNYKERLSILNTYYFPDKDYDTLYPSITPANSSGWSSTSISEPVTVSSRMKATSRHGGVLTSTTGMRIRSSFRGAAGSVSAYLKGERPCYSSRTAGIGRHTHYTRRACRQGFSGKTSAPRISRITVATTPCTSTGATSTPSDSRAKPRFSSRPTETANK